MGGSGQVSPRLLQGQLGRQALHCCISKCHAWITLRLCLHCLVSKQAAVSCSGGGTQLP